MKRIIFLLIVPFLVIAAEGLLRLNPELPSLRSTIVPFELEGRPSVTAPRLETSGCVGPADEDNAVAWVRTFGDGVSPKIRILIAGDSITLGEGVRPEESYGGLIGAALSERVHGPVEVVNVGVNAAGYCDVIRAVHGHLVEDVYDHVLIGFFADDFEQRAVTLKGDEIRADPRMVGGMIGSAASNSYAFNWVWFELLKLAVLTQTDGGRHPVAHITRPGRRIPQWSLDNFSESLARLKTNNPTFLLIPPVGGPLCPSQPLPGMECEWLYADMNQMADRLDASGARFVDLRGLWGDGVDHTQKLERRWWREHQRLPVHPNAAGHSRIADAFIRSEHMPEASD